MNPVAWLAATAPFRIIGRVLERAERRLFPRARVAVLVGGVDTTYFRENLSEPFYPPHTPEEKSS